RRCSDGFAPEASSPGLIGRRRYALEVRIALDAGRIDAIASRPRDGSTCCLYARRRHRGIFDLSAKRIDIALFHGRPRRAQYEAMAVGCYHADGRKQQAIPPASPRLIPEILACGDSD